MTYPNVSGKHAEPSITGPGDFLDNARSAGWDPGPLPVGTVFTFSPVVPARLADDARFVESRQLAPANARYFLTVDEPLVGVSCLVPGAPVMATQALNQIHLGVRRFVAIGAAGAIVESLAPGDVVVLTEAVRDEGVSHHLLPPARYAAADPELTAALAPGARRTKSWTVAIPFVMTARELETFSADGVETVEMEAAALFAVGEARGARTAAAVVISDVTTTAGRVAENWRAVTEPLFGLLDAAIAALRSA
jgi:uridine phosphorylase